MQKVVQTAGRLLGSMQYAALGEWAQNYPRTNRGTRLGDNCQGRRTAYEPMDLFVLDQLALPLSQYVNQVANRSLRLSKFT